MLNSLGKTMNADGTSSGGDILNWKRKAEVYLIESGLPYTIVHPGGLLNEPGNERELCLGVDDTVQGTECRTPSVGRIFFIWQDFVSLLLACCVLSFVFCFGFILNM
jgi:hypothetical protein